MTPMTITRHVFSGLLAAPDGGAPATFEVTCRLVKSLSGLESMHIVGWVDVDGARSPVSRMGVTLSSAAMRGRERGIAMTHLAAEVLRLQGLPGAPR
jgi:hypothetical protein